MFDRSFDYLLISWLAGLSWGLFAHYRRDQRQADRILAKIKEMQDTLKKLQP